MYHISYYMTPSLIKLCSLTASPTSNIPLVGIIFGVVGVLALMVLILIVVVVVMRIKKPQGGYWQSKFNRMHPWGPNGELEQGAPHYTCDLENIWYICTCVSLCV